MSIIYLTHASTSIPCVYYYDVVVVHRVADANPSRPRPAGRRSAWYTARALVDTQNKHVWADGIVWRTTAPPSNRVRTKTTGRDELSTTRERVDFHARGIGALCML